MKEYIERDMVLSHKWEVRSYDPSDPDPVTEVVSVSSIMCVPTADVVEVVRCAECVHRPTGTGVNHDVHFPSDDFTCPCHCDDSYYSWMPKDNWFCANGKR